MSTSTSLILRGKTGQIDTMLIGLSEIKARLAATGTAFTLHNIAHIYKVPVQSSYHKFIDIASEYSKHQSRSGTVTWGGEAVFDLPSVGQFWSDMILNIEIDAMGSKTATAPRFDSAQTQYKYCDYPGVRLLAKTSLTLDGNPIDSYDPDTVMIYRNTELPQEKEAAFDIAVGQEQPIKASLYQYDNQVRQEITVFDGPQTPKTYQPPLSLWLPTHFWFNRSLKRALCTGSASVPLGQRSLSFKLENADKIVQSINSMTGVTSPLSAPPAITKCVLYVNSLTMSEEMYNLYIERAGYNLVRIHNKFSSFLTSAENKIQISSFKFPTEYFYFAFRPASNAASFTNWHKMLALSPVRNILTPTSFLTDSGGGVITDSLERSSITYQEEYVPVNEISFNIAGGSKLYDNLSPAFYGSSQILKDVKIKSARSKGIMIAMFSQKPNEDDVAGYLNLSYYRDLCCQYKSSHITLSNQVEFIALATSINFLPVANGTALKFIT